MLGDPLGERADRPQRVDPERRRNDRSIGDAQPAVGLPVVDEHAAGGVDDAGADVIAHRAAAERVDRDQVVEKQRRVEQIFDKHAAAPDSATRAAQMPAP